jgi:hypothetical protein
MALDRLTSWRRRRDVEARDDEGDARMRELVTRLKLIEERPLAGRPRLSRS